MNIQDAIEMYINNPEITGYQLGDNRTDMVLDGLKTKLATTPVVRVTTRVIDDFVDRLIEEQYGQPFRHQELDAVRAVLLEFFQWAAVEHAIRFRFGETDDPYDMSPILPPLTTDELRRVLELAQELESSTQLKLRNKVIMLILSDTGIYYDELCSLQVGNINLDQREIKLSTRYSNRTLIIGSNCLIALSRYILERDEPGANEPAFVDAEGEQLSIQAVEAMINSVAAASGVGVLDAQRFRRTAATFWKNSLDNVFAVMAFMGHKVLFELLMMLSVSSEKLQDDHRKASPGDRL